MANTVDQLAHDHREINRRVLAVGAALQRLADGAGGTDNNDAADPALRDALAESLGDLHDVLFAHFAREEEALFPFLAESFPELADRVDAMTIAHDAICGALSRAAALAGDVDRLRATYERFEQTYAGHAAQESALLHELDARLDPAQRAALAGLIDDL